MLNDCNIMGRLVDNPELKHTPSGVAVCTMRIACDRDVKNKETGERQTDFIDVVAWRGAAEFAARYFAKGSMVIVKGRLQIRDYTDREGVKRRAAEIQADSLYFGGTKKVDNGQVQDKPVQAQFTEMNDDERLPF